MLNVECPNCQKIVKAQESLLGKNVMCPKCKTTFYIENAEEQQANRFPVSGRTFYPIEETTSPSAKTVALSVGGVILGAVILLVFIMAVQRNARAPVNKPIADPVARQNDDNRYQHATQAAGQAAAIAMLLLFVAWAIMHVCLLIWVAIDARNRGDDNGVLWMIVVFFTDLIGLVIYLAARRKGTLSSCWNCQNRRLAYATVCPHCGVREKPSQS